MLEKLRGDHDDLEDKIKVRRIHHQRHVTATNDARGSYINVLRATVRRYGANVRALGKTAGIEVEVESPRLANDDVTLAHTGAPWVPGFAPNWWKRAVSSILRACPAPACISCDPDPTGIDIALHIGRIVAEIGTQWEPWYMDGTT